MIVIPAIVLSDHEEKEGLFQVSVCWYSILYGGVLWIEEHYYHHCVGNCGVLLYTCIKNMHEN